ncbi:GNAT family N-acetyltransferase [Haloplasma contractile]|uniref:Phospholipiddiacylglycerol acyltransferase protein n=1 Tax=Haloplasma contractile SSD-17B TaxID=1033810 RepID=F7PWQ1_9MOLU|nr:GNAT family N-acetyltransferase [Haloplasma contractile]ERJ12574.1 phospholipiddiacylglycerol acyltransferase protein [Haloplasma contractile SSD-17B]
MNCLVCSEQKHFYDQVRVRKEVFIIEQKVPIEEEYDVYDSDAIQFIVYDGEKPVGAARYRIVKKRGKIERVCILKEYRKKGVGRLLMNSMENHIKLHADVNELILNSQCTALDFYRRLGYQEFGDLFLDANIEHKSMKKLI